MRHLAWSQNKIEDDLSADKMVAGQDGRRPTHIDNTHRPGVEDHREDEYVSSRMYRYLQLVQDSVYRE